MKVKLVNYFDVWGNEKDGWEINNLCEECILDIGEGLSSDILKALKRIDFFKKHVRLNMLDFESLGEFGIEIFQRSNYKPICRLEYMEED